MPKRDPVLAALGRNVRRQRDAKTFTQEKLAERSGLDPTYISDIERGLRNPGIKNVAKLAKALGFTTAEMHNAWRDQLALEMNRISVREIKSFIDALCNEESYEPIEGRWTFRSGGDCSCCWEGASKIATAFRGRMVRYKSLQNPTALIGRAYCEGHDFAIIGNRYVVDYWAYRIAQLIATPTLDMNNPNELELVGVLYGDRQTWQYSVLSITKNAPIE